MVTPVTTRGERMHRDEKIFTIFQCANEIQYLVVSWALTVLFIR